MNDSILVLWGENFESGENGWYLDSGWEITESNADTPSPTHSVLSPNSDNNQSGVYNLLTPLLHLPVIGSNETMHFGFYLYADMPDSDGDGDDYLDDYYGISILDISESAWHSSDFNTVDGNSFWCADEDVEGYLDSWIQYLDSPSIPVGSGGELSARIYYEIESPDDVEVEDSCADGWDSANIRISKDGGMTWSLLEDSLNPYHYDCGYGWIWNDDQYETSGPLNHLAKSWGGSSNGWVDFSADLSEYSGQNIIIRFAFGSDPSWSTVDDDLLTGFQVDEISVSDDSGVLFSNNGDDLMDMTASGEVWMNQFYDYGSVEDGRPGSDAWELYWYDPNLDGMPFNGNVFMDISAFEGKIIQLRIQSRYDNNHDGGQGAGLFIDDFMIYKLSMGAYFAPWSLEAETGDGEVSLTWVDMNASGTKDFIYDNGDFEFNISVDGWAGALFDIIGPATINSFSIYNIYQLDTTISIGVYGMFGSTIDTDPTHSMEVLVHSGWNDVSVTDWNVENNFIIAHKISSSFGAAFDTTNITLRSHVRFGEGAWEPIYNYLMEIEGEDVQLLGEFGIRANITYDGAGVTYNVYRDDESIETGFSISSYTDRGLINNTTYEYGVSATYSNDKESGQSNLVSAMPFSNSVHEESVDDGSFETEFTAGTGNFSAVRYSADAIGEVIEFFKWFQYGGGGAFYIKVFEDTLGVPGTEIYSAVQASGNTDGWNKKDLSEQGLVVSGDFWIGIKEFSSSKPFGLDTTSVNGNSYQKAGSGGNWTAVNGNLAYHVFLDCGDNCIDECSVLDGSVWPGNTNADNIVNVDDLLSIGIYWDQSVCKRSEKANDIYKWESQPLLENNCISHADANGDGVVDIADILIIIVNWEKETSNGDGMAYIVDNSCISTETDLSRYYSNFQNIYNNLKGSSEPEIQMKNRLEELFGFSSFPSHYQIYQSYPNPFNPIVSMPYFLPQESMVALAVYNILGQKVLTESAFVSTAGYHEIEIDGTELSSGVYYYQFIIDGSALTPMKMVLLK